MDLRRLLAETGATNTVMVLGPPGSGKSHHINQCCTDLGASVFPIALINLVSQSWAKSLFKIFTSAIECHSKLKIIHMLNIQYIFPSNHLRQDLYEALILGILLLKELSNVHVVCEACNSSEIHPLVVDLFKNQVMIPSPTNIQLENAFLSIYGMELDREIFRPYLDGLNFKDIQYLCQVVDRTYNNEPCKTSATLPTSNEIIKLISKISRKSTLVDKIKRTGWKDIGGYHSVKRLLEQSIILPNTHSQEYKDLGIEPSFGTLLYGVSGTGKTMFARCIAQESSSTFYPISMQSLVKGHIGESEKAIANIFSEARKHQPSIIFLDEIESLFSNRDLGGDLALKIYSQIVHEFTILHHNKDRVHFLAATNHIERIDPSLLVSGRIDRHIKVDLPTFEDRVEIIQIYLSKLLMKKQVDVVGFAIKTEGMNCSEVCESLRRAALIAVESGQSLTMADV